jgi:hypothetical protein
MSVTLLLFDEGKLDPLNCNDKRYSRGRIVWMSTPNESFLVLHAGIIIIIIIIIIHTIDDGCCYKLPCHFSFDFATKESMSNSPAW